MIITRTPYRISFFGGGTDYPDWYREHGGAVLSTTIDKYCYISARFLPPFFHHRHSICWSHIELVSSISEILHPVVREGLRFLGFDDSVGVEIHHQGDLPARSGIGSSSSFTVGLIKALTLLRGREIDKQELASKAIHLEQQVLNESVGSQDQIAAAYGGFNVIRLATNGNIHVEPVKVSQTRLEALESRLLLFYTGTSRFAPDMAARIIAGLRSRAAVMQAIHGTFDRGLRILSGDGDLDEFGELLHEAWLLKKQLSPTVSTPGLESLYSTATRHGALGGKVLGAGGGGFVMLYVPPERQPLVIDALAPYLRVPVRFERRGCHALVSEGDAPMPAGIVSPVL